MNSPECSKIQPRFEAFLMTGDKILNISKIPRSTLLTKQRRVANSRYHNCSYQMNQIKIASLPNSPNEKDLDHYSHKSLYTSSLECSKKADTSRMFSSAGKNFVRNSRSDDQLQGQNANASESMGTDSNEDVASSINTLLDTGSDNTNNSDDSDRIVWTFNAPSNDKDPKLSSMLNGSNSSLSSPPQSDSLSSPTSVSSSVMDSHKLTYSYNPPYNNSIHETSVSEAISNMSSPDYHDETSLGIRDCVMEVSDPSDSDSTILVSESYNQPCGIDKDYRIVIQVKGPDKSGCENGMAAGVCDCLDRGSSLEIEPLDLQTYDLKNSDPNYNNQQIYQTYEDDSDAESLHSFYYSPKAVDIPSAIRLAKRLFSLDGFKKSDISRHLSKNNDFSKAVAEEYLKYFNFEKETLDVALRKFLKQFTLTGETQERERVLVHFSKRYLICNPGSFNSQDAVHTLTCAIMLLNTDLHGPNLGRKMNCDEFIENLADLNEGKNFPKDILKQIYYSIKNYPLEWALDENGTTNVPENKNKEQIHQYGSNPFLEVPIKTNSVDYKRGYVMRKCCFESNRKRTPFHKRSWKMFYCTLQDLMLFLHKDENGFRKNEMGDNVHNAIRIHHALATKASDYTKKQYVFRLQTADQAEYLFQTSDSKELQSWIDTINFVCASFSAAPLEAAVGSQKKFQRPLLPSSLTKYTLREQLRDHEERVIRLENELEDHRRSPPEKGSKSLIVHNYKEKENYLNFEVKRYRTYVYILSAKINQYQDISELQENSCAELDEAATTNRHSYRQAIYNRNFNHFETANG